MRRWFISLKDPVTSWNRFKLGLVIFLVGVALLFIAGPIHIGLHFFALAVLLCGFAIAMTGYAGIFLQRITSLNPKKHQSIHRDD
ncbi:hypothetical protein CA267_008690 [Alteromonas pelagimontana]|uniref:Uncharacterized protein n=1 Tax=Alteromonas pelagimontana TaxID=1858656 RepID=A0A6M4MCB7_9ALTE|nr:hypothetical protein [Alteromonas pelagimontana]QJR80851.1 hypothetical protein CA267_008690 [Alteromonas pelagimontana]